jgi:WD40 repeat protein/transcriptional regulator with XRE-family HTH domain
MPTSIPASTLEKFITFGDLLRFLRRRTGLTQMELAIAVGYSNTQISRLEQNERLPDIPTIEARFVSALELEEEPKTVARLLDLAANVRREDAPATGSSPYKGLNYFDESDADLFMGREQLTAKLTERVLSLASTTSPEASRFLAIVGASGSGKSSLVRAGLVSALRWNRASTDWQVHILTPTAHPLENLAAALTHESNSVTATAALMDDLARDERSLQIFAKRILDSKNGARLLLVVDQFEELFALCRLEEERVAFIENLLTAASQADGPVIVVITLRADFYAPCANYPPLREALAAEQEYIGAMNDEELRRAIEEPAQRGRWELEPGLVDLLLHDVGREPGALPLLSHALFETWQRRRGRMMTLSGYTSSGGVRGAIAETAEAVFADQFTHEQQAIARRIFLRLTELGDEAGAGDTRRRATFDELILKPEEAATTHAVLKSLADARLITTSEDAAEVAHEALIREWPTLHSWLEENREGLRLHRQLTEAAQAWSQMNHDPDLLYRGARLAQIREWAAPYQEEMNELEHEFLAASIETSEHQAAEREAQRQRELEAVQKLADAERKRAEEQTYSANRLRARNRVVTTLSVIAVILAVLAAAFSIQSNRNAEQAQANLTRSEAQRLAAEANNLRLNNGDSNLIALLAIRSLTMQYTPSGDAVLSSLTALEAPPQEFKGHTADLWNVDFSPDGKVLATGSDDKTARIWDVATGETIRVFSGHTGEVYGVVFSPDGKYLLTGSSDTTVRLWDVATGETVQIFSGHTGDVDAGDFSPNGKTIVTAGSSDLTARIWDVASGQTLHILTGHSELVIRAVYSPDGKYVLTASVDGTARLWDAATGKEVRLFEHPNVPGAITFSPDGKYIATGCEDNVTRIWNIATGQIIREFTGHEGFVQGVRFSPDGKYLLTGSGDRTARLWDIETGGTIRIFGGHADDVQIVTFSPDGKLIATASNDRIARVWSLQTIPGGMQFIGHNRFVQQASFSPDGKRVVTASLDTTARIWDTGNGQLLITLKGHTSDLRGAIFSPDGNMVLTAGQDSSARLWDAATGKELRRFEGHTDIVSRAIFSPDGKYVVTASYDGTARVWDTQTGQAIVTYTNQGPGHVNRVAFSAVGKSVATTGDDGTARIWDLLTGEDLMVFKGHTDIVAGVTFSPDGKYLVTSSFDGSVRLWEVTSGMELRRFIGHLGVVFGVAFSPDGRYILSGGADGTARLWNVQTGEEVRRFIGHSNQVRDVAFSPDGKYVLTASNDNTTRLWLTDLDDTIQAVCALLTRDLTPEERMQFGITDEAPTCPGQ